jgi:molybdate transport system permease protein
MASTRATSSCITDSRSPELRWPSILPQLSLSPDEQETILLSLGVAARAVGFALPLATLVALLLARGRFPGRFLLHAVVHLPLVLPPVVTGWLLLLIFGVEGPVGALLQRYLDVRLAFTEAGAALACGVMIFPIMVRAIRLSMEAVDPQLEQAARTLGAPAIDRFFSITLPLALPGVVAAAVLGYTASLGEFGAVITFAANIPGQTRTLPLAIYSALDTPGGDAVAARLALLSVGLALVGLLLAELLMPRRARGGGR